LRAAQKIERYLQGFDYEQFIADEMRVDAVLYNLFVIGEAAKHIPDEVREKYSQVMWQRIAGLRDVLAHEYFRVDLEIVWSITQGRVAELNSQIADILEQEDEASPPQ